MQFAGFVDQFVKLLPVSGCGHLVAHLGREHVGVAEGSFNQGCEVGRNGVVSGRVGAADEVEDFVTDELCGRDTAGLRGLFDLVPFGVGEANAPVLAGRGGMLFRVLVDFGASGIDFGHGFAPFSAELEVVRWRNDAVFSFANGLFLRCSCYQIAGFEANAPRQRWGVVE